METHQTTDLGIAGSIPAGLVFLITMKKKKKKKRGKGKERREEKRREISIHTAN